MPPILFSWPTTSGVDVDGMTIKIESSREYLLNCIAVQHMAAEGHIRQNRTIGYSSVPSHFPSVATVISSVVPGEVVVMCSIGLFPLPPIIISRAIIIAVELILSFEAQTKQ